MLVGLITYPMSMSCPRMHMRWLSLLADLRKVCTFFFRVGIDSDGKTLLVVLHAEALQAKLRKVLGLEVAVFILDL